MRTDARRQAVLAPNLERLEELMEQISSMYLERREVEPQEELSADKA